MGNVRCGTWSAIAAAVCLTLPACADDGSPSSLDVAAIAPATTLAESTTSAGPTTDTSAASGTTAPGPATESTTTAPAVTRDQIVRFRNGIVGAPYLQGFDVSIPGSLEGLLGYRDTVLSGTVVDVRVAEPARLQMSEDQDSYVNGPNFAEMGVLVEVAVDAVHVRSGTVPPVPDWRSTRSSRRAHSRPPPSVGNGAAG
jgi:hypothetical protein